MADARNRANVLTGAPDVQVGGGISIGKVATQKDQVPTDASGALSEGLSAKPVGYISSDGVTKTVDRTTEKIKDWNGDTVIVLTTEHSVILKTTFMEAANADLLKTVYGTENVKVQAGAVTLVDNAEDLPHFSLDINIKSAGGRKLRVFGPDVQVTSVGDVSFVRNDVIKYEVEMECFADFQSNKLYTFIDRPSEAASASAGASSPGVGG